MDGINPDYLAAQTLNPEISNPNWAIPSVIGPVLGGLYFGVENYYVGVIAFKLLGENVTSLRIAQSLFGGVIIVLVYLLLWKCNRNILTSFLAAALLASNIAFLASFRTQFYIILGGEVWLLASVLTLWRETKLSDYCAGVLYGLAIYAYFVFLFFMPAITCIVLFRKNRSLRSFLLGITTGLLPYAIGYLSLTIALGSISRAIDWVRGAIINLAPLSSTLSIIESLKYAFVSSYLAISNIGNNLMIFNDGSHSIMGNIQVAIFVFTFIMAAITFRKRRELLIVFLPISY
ncbi:MAG: hypothetical protein ACREBJ_07610, partial [Nitrosotalea sp.]